MPLSIGGKQMLTFLTENEQDKIQVEASLLDLMISAAEAAYVFEGFEELDAEVSLTLTDDEGIQVLNREHRDKDSATDVLSFPQYESLKDLEEIEEDFLYLGDVVISVERAKEQAERYGHSFEREMCFLVVHSMLHLFGYDHMSIEEEKEMTALQEAILSQMGITRA